jgi:hypothetical protein
MWIKYFYRRMIPNYDPRGIRILRIISLLGCLIIFVILYSLLLPIALTTHTLTPHLSIGPIPLPNILFYSSTGSFQSIHDGISVYGLSGKHVVDMNPFVKRLRWGQDAILHPTYPLPHLVKYGDATIYAILPPHGWQFTVNGISDPRQSMLQVNISSIWIKFAIDANHSTIHLPNSTFHMILTDIPIEDTLHHHTPIQLSHFPYQLHRPIQWGTHTYLTFYQTRIQHTMQYTFTYTGSSMTEQNILSLQITPSHLPIGDVFEMTTYDTTHLYAILQCICTLCGFYAFMLHLFKCLFGQGYFRPWGILHELWPSSKPCITCEEPSMGIDQGTLASSGIQSRS